MDFFNASASVLLLALVAAIAAFAKTFGDLLDARDQRRVTRGTVVNFLGGVAVGVFTAVGIGVALWAANQFWVFLGIVLGVGLVLPFGAWCLWRVTPAELKRPADH